MKPYEKYKESGLSFLEKIPEKWRVQKIKFFVNIYNGDSLNDAYKIQFESYNLDDLAYISSKDIDVDNSKVQYENGLRIPKDFGKFKIAPTNSILICIEGGSAGKKIAFTNQPVHFVNKLACLNTINGESSKFLFYSLKANLFQSQFKNSIAGLIGGVSISNLKNFYLTIPPLQEQTAIAKYLDHQTAIIDELIEKKTKQIALLKEKRQAIINETVTKGLDPTAKMKDSGVSWLGEIPESWKIVALRHLCTKIGSGVTPKGGADVYTEEGVIFIRSQNVHFDGLRLDDVVRIEQETHEKMSGSQVMYKDVLLNITGASIGRCSVVNIQEEMNVNQHVCIIRPNNKISPEYLNLVLQSNVGQTQVKTGTTGGNREGLTFEAIKEFIVPVPALESQFVIVSKIEELLKQFQNLESKNIDQIEKLKEYRQSLISEAVTGKIDVRGWGALIQEEA